MENSPYQRLELFWKAKGLKNAAAFADSVKGLTPAALSAMKKRGSLPSAPSMRYIQIAYPDINPDYILFAEGEMLKGGRALTYVAPPTEGETATQAADSGGEPEPPRPAGGMSIVRLTYEELLAENADLHRQLKTTTGQVVDMLTQEVKRLRKPLTSSEAADLRETVDQLAREIPAALYVAPGFKQGVHRQLA